MGWDGRSSPATGGKVLQADGSVGSVMIEEFDTSHPVVSAMPEKIFASIVSRCIESGAATSGRVGRAHAYLLPADALVSFAVPLVRGYCSSTKVCIVPGC